jgi:CRISPR-associated endonuclease/helicase Cas3
MRSNCSNGMAMNGDLKLFSFWAKTSPAQAPDLEGGFRPSPIFHPLIYHLLDVAACAEALLRQEAKRMNRLAHACGIDADVLSRCFVTLIALHDIGKCAFGFQGKVPDLWPEILGSPPKQVVPVRHDAAGAWLLTANARLAKIVATLLPDILPSKLVQAVCGHHGEPIDRQSFPDIGNHGRTIGATAQDAAVAIAEALAAFFKPDACRFDEPDVELVSFWLAGLAVVADWLGSNRTWFDFRPVPESGDLASNIATYWETCARPGAERAMNEAGLRPVAVASRTGLHHLFDSTYQATPLQDHAEKVELAEGPLLFIIEDMTGAGKTEAAVILAHRMMQKGKASGFHVALPTMATANAMFERLAKHYRFMFEGDHPPSIVLTHGRRELFEGFRTLPGSFGEYAGEADDADDPSGIEASAFCADCVDFH